MRSATGGEAVKSSEKRRICLFENAWNHKPVRGWVAQHIGRAANACLNRKIAPTNVSTQMTSSSESEDGLGASQ
jgi:hypothetical protein